MKIAILGRNKHLKDLEKLFNRNVEISFFLDNNTNLSGTWIGDKKIYSPYDFPRGEINYIVVFLMEYEAVNQELIDLGIEKEKIVNFNSSELEISGYENLFNLEEAKSYRLNLKIEYLERRIKQLEKNQQFLEENYMYEIAAKLKNGELTLPIIFSVEDTNKKIITDKRFIVNLNKLPPPAASLKKSPALKRSFFLLIDNANQNPTTCVIFYINKAGNFMFPAFNLC